MTAHPPRPARIVLRMFGTLLLVAAAYLAVRTHFGPWQDAPSEQRALAMFAWVGALACGLFLFRQAGGRGHC